MSTGIDLLSTLAGGGREMIARLVSPSGLKALLIGVDDWMGTGGDTVNP